jgi:hypothetical protein
VRALCLVALLWPTLAAIPPAEAASFVSAIVKRVLMRTPFARAFAPAQDSEAKPHHTYAQRVTLTVRASHEIYSYEPVVSATVIDPETASAEIRGEHTVVVRGLAKGETILVVSTRSGRTAYAIAVIRTPPSAARKAAIAQAVEQPESYAGSYSLTFSPATGGAPTLLRHAFEFSRKYAGGRVLRAGADISQLFGRGERGVGRPLDSGFDANNLTLGLDSDAGTLDLLDSELNVSPLGLRGFRVRGPHLVSAGNSPLRGAEIFAGVAHASHGFYDGDDGRLAGLLLPVAGGRTWRARAGAVWVSPRRESRGVVGGLVFQTDVRYARGERLSAEGEAAYANGGLSWRARFDAERGDFKFYGEALKVDRNSPYISIGAQPGGRSMNTFGARWQHWPRLTASASFRRTTTGFASPARRTPLDGSTLFAGLSLRAAGGSHFTFNFTRQQLETPARTAADFLWRLSTNSATYKYSQRLGRRWSNDFEARVTSSDEAGTGARLSRGVQLREQLRFNFRGGSVTAYVRRSNNTPSLAGLIIRNPTLLPAAVRQAFETDPVSFLITNRNLLPRLLPGAELPATRGTDIGARFQAALSRRFDFTGEARYGAGEFSSISRRDLFTELGLSARLDAANTVRVSASRLFGGVGSVEQTSFTLSFVHRFGAGSGGGMSLARLFGFDRGRVRGRVFLDSDSDGQEDEGEAGLAGMRVALDGGRSATTDAHGNFAFGASAPGGHMVALVSERLGVDLRASGPTEQRVQVEAREGARVAFGLNDFGFVSGRVFNDLSLAGVSVASEDAPGVGGVRVLLRLANGAVGPSLSQTVGAGGAYEFRNVAPGDYILEVDAATLPADFRLHAGAAWTLTVSPLRELFTGVPVAAERAISGVVFADADGDGRLTPQRDAPLAGVRVRALGVETLSAKDGSYLLRNLPAGRVIVRASRTGGDAREVAVELEARPSFKRDLNFAF